MQEGGCRCCGWLVDEATVKGVLATRAAWTLVVLSCPAGLAVPPSLVALLEGVWHSTSASSSRRAPLAERLSRQRNQQHFLSLA